MVIVSLLGTAFVKASGCEGFGCVGYAVISMVIGFPVTAAITLLIHLKVASVLKKEGESKWDYGLTKMGLWINI